VVGGRLLEDRPHHGRVCVTAERTDDEGGDTGDVGR
jgi:hypothetical protein